MSTQPDQGGGLTKPKRFLTAYNFFFMRERAAHLQSREENEDSSQRTPSSTAPKRQKRDTDDNGKLGFAKSVAKKWKEITPSEKKVYQDLSKKDLARYKKELKEYHKKKRDEAWENYKQTMDTSIDLTMVVPNNDKRAGAVMKSPTGKRFQRKDCSVNQKNSIAAQPPKTLKHTDKKAIPLPSPSQQVLADKEKETTLKPVKVNSMSSSDEDKDNNAAKESKDMEEFDNATTVGNVSVDSDAMDTFAAGSISFASLFNNEDAEANGKKEGLENSGANGSEIVYESLSTRVLYCSNQRHELGGASSTEAIGVKLLTDQFPEAERISRLENEYKISQYLSSKKCKSVRAVLQLINNGGVNALYLEWLKGMSLKEWIKAAHKSEASQVMEASSSGHQNERPDGTVDNQFDIDTAVYLASEVSKALAEVHSCSVAHNNVNSDNIFVPVDENNGSVSVRIIDLGQASLLSGQDNEAQKLQNDLCSLGAVLFELFVGKNPYQNSEELAPFASHDNKPSAAEKVLSAGNRCDGVFQLPRELRSLLRSKVPSCVSTIIFNLIEKRGEVQHYKSVREVDKDFHVILSDPEYFLHNVNDKVRTNPFNSRPSKLYGRDKEVSMLLDAYGRITQANASSEMVIVSGLPGAGKSALVQQMRKPVQDHGGIFLCSKFDQLQQMEPLSAITAPFTDLCDEIVRRDDANKLQQTRSAIQKAIRTETDVLANVIPSLRQIIEVPTGETIKVSSMEAQNRLKYIFRLFVRAVATPTRPLVLFLDDLQWADTTSLDLIETLITDAESTSFLLIGSYRENEVGETHPLAVTLHRIQRKHIITTKIDLANLSNDDTNELISDTIQTPSHVTEPLANAVYRKTSGNVMFVLQFLSSLCDEGLLYISPLPQPPERGHGNTVLSSSIHSTASSSCTLESKQWQWDTSVIESKAVAYSAVELMSCKILQLAEETQPGLKLLACLGSFCEESVLRMIVPNDSVVANSGQLRPFCFGYTDLILHFKSAVKEGLIYIDRKDSKYTFVHDLIQFSSYRLIPENERGHWHLWIGNQVWSNKAASPEKALFIAVGQLNKGITHIHDNNQRIELARLNLQAGEKCISLAAFAPASIYLKTGIALLDENCWLDHYDLSLQLHDRYAESKNCEGEFEEMNKAINENLHHARCLGDKVRSYFTIVGALLAQGKPREALKVGLFVLAQLGEPIDTSTNKKPIILLESLKTKKMLDGKTDDDLLTLKEMDNAEKIAAVRLIKILNLCAYIADQQLYPLLVFRMVCITLSHGVCNESVLCFAEYGAVLSCIFHDTTGAYRFGRISLHLLAKLDAKECLAQVYLMIYSMIHSGIKSHHASIEPMRHAYEIGMRCGNIYYAMMNAWKYCTHLFECGNELSTVERVCREYGEKMMEHKLTVILNHTLPYRQAALNLMGRSNDPLQLNGDAMDEDKVLKYAVESRRMALVSIIYHLRSWLAYIFCDYELASKMAEESKLVDAQWSVSNLPPFWRSNYIFIDGLVSFALAQKANEEKWKTLALSATETMETFTKHAPSNFQHKFLLLRAESAFLNKNIVDASMYYDAAIKTAGENGFIQDQAIAYERAGYCHFSVGNSLLASQYYGKAHTTYLTWGASCKAEHLCMHSPI